MSRSSRSDSSQLSTASRSPSFAADAVEKHRVDAHRVGQRLAQARGRLQIQRQRAIAVLQVEIDERDAPVLPVGEMPGETGRDRRRADAAARPDAGDQLAEPCWLSAVLRSGLSVTPSRAAAASPA